VPALPPSCFVLRASLYRIIGRLGSFSDLRPFRDSGNWHASPEALGLCADLWHTAFVLHQLPGHRLQFFVRIEHARDLCGDGSAGSSRTDTSRTPLSDPFKPDPSLGRSGHSSRVRPSLLRCRRTCRQAGRLILEPRSPSDALAFGASSPLTGRTHTFQSQDFSATCRVLVNFLNSTNANFYCCPSGHFRSGFSPLCYHFCLGTWRFTSAF